MSARRGGAPVTLGPPQRRAVLALLLLARSQAVPVAVIRDRLWPTGAPATAIDAIQVHVHHLRRRLREHTPAGAPSAELVSYPGHSREQASYALRVDAEAVDALAFQRLADRGRELEGLRDLEGALRMCVAAQSHWRGEPLADLEPTPYVRAIRQGLVDLCQDVRTRAARLRMRTGAFSDAALDLQQLNLEHPGNDVIVELLSTALFLTGRRERALALLNEEVARCERQYARVPEQLLRQRELILSDALEEEW
ncbi:AfsR/SARP family transcriptional regulator [Kitasatospora cathayae]|uniref:BTAD domain-containing putative transcriptional regulator n=1 Tax=Kitasatospora cathayae TaxID=3004092 RepID=A0ABY7PYG5_9ACTN|nr:BTAD domain-containing putative transcriptional regulator [Kitasatospora sp. HUAS 3-15]WBP85400.1 BTAD domain-containing putative transcriptional regulator [Kitasatospora sp. HUAS 3-15]